MPERWSKIIALAECVFLLAPLTLVAIWGALALGSLGVGYVGMGFTRHAIRQILFGAVLLVNIGLLLCALGSGWFLMYSFLRGGARRLRLIPAAYWLIPALGAMILIIGRYMNHVTSISMNGRPDTPIDAFAIFGQGSQIVALFPLIHLFLERTLRANNRMERARE